MLKDQDALNLLAELSDQPEKSRSSYWNRELANLDLKADGTMTGYSPQGNVSRKTGPLHSLAHWVLQAPFRRLGGRYRYFSDCQRLGRAVARGQGRQYTSDMVRQSLALGLIREHISPAAMDGVNVVIGDGYGVMTSLLRRAFPEKPVIAVNLKTPLLADLLFAREALTDKSLVLSRDRQELAEAIAAPNPNIIGLMADDAHLLGDVPVALAINIHSMQEMPVSVVADYFRFLRSNPAPKTAFYCCNRAYKKLPGGEELKFEDFPWQGGDDVLVDEICPWDHIEYGPTPPFWRKNPNQIRHRLAYLKKDI